MIALVLQLADSFNATGYTEAGQALESVKIGFIILTIIVLPVVSLVAASIAGHPRTFRVPGLFMGMVTLLITSLVLSFLVIGAVLKLVVPQ